MPAARLFAYELRRWEAQLENSINRYAIALGLAMLDRAKRASHIDPPASSYAIMRRARPYRGENPVPGKDVRGELDPTPGIRERPRPFSDMGGSGKGPILRHLPDPRYYFNVCIHDRAQHDPAFVRPIIAGSAVHRGQLVPHQHIADAPVMVINEAILRRVLGQFLDQRPGFLPRHADETMRVHRVDEQDRPTGHRVLDHRGPLHFVIHLFGFSFVIAIEFLTGGSGAAAVQAHQGGEPVLHGFW